MEQLKALKKDMEKKRAEIDSFLFTYENFEYIVLVHLYSFDESRPDYALLKLEFIKTWAGREHLRVPANASCFLIEAGVFRHYFGIPYEAQLAGVFQQFYACFAECIPTRVRRSKSEAERKAIAQHRQRVKKSGDFCPQI
ncbi:hypothetical protein B9G55_03645 [Saccharibacillus sp. O16]|nr:hypothetical protein B9G55_03645 [Saccharibacillus sp. O16]